MCGIAGILDLTGTHPADLLKMSNVLRHRGPDDEGFLLVDPAADNKACKGSDTIPAFAQLPSVSDMQPQQGTTIGLVHRRLSILDLSPNGHQPMSYAEGRYSIVYNGEVYNYKELRATLQNEGLAFRTESDTEVILAAYHRWGTACVQQFVGMWAFAIFDKEKQILFFSRDRFGIKPLYYSLHKQKLAFASEIKALLAIGDITPEANMDAVFEYISFGATSDPSANLFKHVQVLAPGQNMVVQVNTLSIKHETYYNLAAAVQTVQVPKDATHAFEAHLNESIDLHLRSDVPVGSTLSGGLDSSTLVAMAAAKMRGNTFNTFTAAYREKNIDESGYAKKVTDALPNVQAHYSYPEISGYWQDLDKLIWHQDLPINSTSMFAQWEVMKSAKQAGIKVLLDGQGADEILGGYYNFAGIHLIEQLKRFKLATFFSEKKQLKEKFTPQIHTVIGRAGFYFLPEFMQRKVRSRKRIGMSAVAVEHSAALQQIRVPERGGKSYREQSLLSMQFGLQDLLRYEDRNSMAYSIESRVPFLDHRLVEFSIALDNSWKIKNGWTKYILRKTAEPLLAPEVVWRKDKMGFLTPQQDWKQRSQKELQAFFHDTTIPSFLNKDHILKLSAADMNNSAHLSEFWKIVSFLKWASVFKVTFPGT